MPIIQLTDLHSTDGPLLAIDPGTKTLGLAISDKTRLIATPLLTIKREKFSKDAQTLLNIYDTKEAVAIIIGMPINMNGSKGPRAQSVKDFCTNLLKIHDVPLLLWDERLSTLAVTRTLLEGDVSRRKRTENVDKLAATYILQGLLDRLRY